MADPDLEREVEQRVEALGFELVALEQVGSKTRPILRVYLDRPDSVPGESSVSVDDCAHVSRTLEAELDERPGLSPRYVLEVSSPGVERPLVRTRDFRRFAGQEVALQGRQPLAGRAKRLEGVLLGVEDEGAQERVLLQLPDGDRLEIPREEVSRAHLIFRWGGGGRR